MILGSLVLQKYTYAIDLDQNFLYLGEKNATYANPNMGPDPIKPDIVQERNILLVAVIVLGSLLLIAVGVFTAFKLGCLCFKKNRGQSFVDFGDIKKGKRTGSTTYNALNQSQGNTIATQTSV